MIKPSANQPRDRSQGSNLQALRGLTEDRLLRSLRADQALREHRLTRVHVSGRARSAARRWRPRAL